MIITKLDVQQFRGFQKAVLKFEPGFNLLIGENGAGKSSVLWALRVLFSHIHKSFRISEDLHEFSERDIANAVSNDWPFLNATLEFRLGESEATPLVFFAQKNRRRFVEGEAGKLREQVVETRDQYHFVEFDSRGNLQEAKPPYLAAKQARPLAVFYSAHRSVIAAPSVKGRKVGNHPAYAQALEERPLDLLQMARLWRTETELHESDGLPERANRAITKALPVFLEDFDNLRIEGGDEARLVVNKSGVRLELMQLSDGERSLLAILMDLTRRLALANPNLANPARKAEAVVLIDEIDLHLHPRWQRTVVEKLTTTFPKCQFIATTHSPQIIGEVPPENIILLETGKAPCRPDQSQGMDSNWILRYLMGTEERPTETQQALAQIAQLIEKEHYPSALKKIAALRKEIGEFDELVRLQTRIDRIRVLGE